MRTNVIRNAKKEKPPSFFATLPLLAEVFVETVKADSLSKAVKHKKCWTIAIYQHHKFRGIYYTALIWYPALYHC